MLNKKWIYSLLPCAAILTAGLEYHAQSLPEAYVNKVLIKDVVAQLEQGSQVLFIDTREPDEFKGFHIPNAINVPLRSITPATIDELALSSKDLVVPYCLKDLRGYEVARRLKDYGLENVATLSPSGLNGWKSYWAEPHESRTIISPNKV